MDRVQACYFVTTFVAYVAMGDRCELAHCAEYLVPVYGDLQVLPVAAGAIGALADVMGAAIATTGRQLVKEELLRTSLKERLMPHNFG
jgi:hypothetical protein